MNDKILEVVLCFIMACFFSTFYAGGGNAFFFLNEEQLKYFRWSTAAASVFLFYIWVVRFGSEADRPVISVDGVKYYADVYDEMTDIGICSESIRFLLANGEKSRSGERTRIKGSTPDGTMVILIINKDGIIEDFAG